MTFYLSAYDEKVLAGEMGEAARIALNIIIKIAKIQQANQLLDVSHVHIGGSIYTGKHSLQIIEEFAALGGKVVVPTTMNAISLDRRLWKEQNINQQFAINANRLALAYERMGVQPTFSCTPYIFPNGPQLGDDIVWAESNAIAYANSVLGARTNRHGDFLDICAAITGRAPKTGLHLEENRCGTFIINVPEVSEKDSEFFTVLGYAVGKLSNKGVPVVNMGNVKPTLEQLKSFSSTVSTAGPVGLYHIVGVTPEATTVEMALGGNDPEFVHDLSMDDLKQVWEQLSTGNKRDVEMVVMGSPHFTIEECRELAERVEGEIINPAVDVLITTSTYVYEMAKKLGYTGKIEDSGIRFSTDICLCMLSEDMLDDKVQTLMTNSGKFAHYGPGLVNKKVIFASFEECVKTAVTGKRVIDEPVWLKNNQKGK